MAVPTDIKIYHILHVDRLPSVLDDGFLWSDSETRARSSPGTTVGMGSIKARRLSTELASHPGLKVGGCVPFYFCPRSIMLYMLHKGNQVEYKGGQGPIVHLRADLHATVDWANANGLRWGFTLSNAGSLYFEDRDDLAHLTEINWNAVRARIWNDPDIKEAKQAEFLLEGRFPWHLVERIGVQNNPVGSQVTRMMGGKPHRPPVETIPGWYY